MSTAENNEYNEQAGDEASEYVDDGAIAAEDSVIVTEERQPVNRSTLVMFAVIVLGAVVLYVMYRRTGPLGANAATVTKETDEARKTISSFLSGGDSNFKSIEARLKYTEKVVQQFRKYPSATQVPLNDLSTNPFRQHAPEVKKAGGDEGLSEAAEKKRREEEKLAIRKAAEGLQLQSIMYSDTRKACMINNTLYREGQNAGDFTVDKISPATVDVHNGPYRFQLRIDR
jgi:predicted nucleic acid-binding Zn ribbon protein